MDSFYLSTSLAFSKADVPRLSSELRERYTRSSTVALRGVNGVEILLALVALNGWVKNIALIPTGVTMESNYVEQQSAHHTNITLFTSGTTSHPKLVAHSLPKFIRPKEDFSHSEGGGSQTWGLLYDPFRMAGLQVITNAYNRSENLVCPEFAWTLAEKIKFFIANSVTKLSATPSMWAQIMQISDSSHLDLKQITLGGEIVSQRVLDNLKMKFPKAQITQIYATTELGQIFSVHDGREGFPIEFLQSRGNQALRVDSENRLEVKNLDGVFIQTGDLVQIVDSRVHFIGRSDGLTNIGGFRVNPFAIESSLMRYPGVLDAKVFPAKSSILGNILHAEVQLEPGSEVSERNLRDELKMAHAAHEIPAIIRFVNKISLTENGKKTPNEFQ